MQNVRRSVQPIKVQALLEFLVMRRHSCTFSSQQNFPLPNTQIVLPQRFSSLLSQKRAFFTFAEQ